MPDPRRWLRSRAGVAALLLLMPAACREGPGVYDPPERRVDGNQRQLTFNADREFYPTWSADGDSLYYSTADFASFPRYARTLLRVAVNGGTAARVAPSAQGSSAAGAGAPPLTFPAVSAESGRLAYVELFCQWTGTSAIPPYPCVGASALVRATLRIREPGSSGSAASDAGIPIPVHPQFRDLDELPFRPSWSPDGERVAFGDGMQLYIWTRGETAAVPVPGTEGARAAAWHPHADEIAFARGNSIALLNVGTGAVRQVAGGGDPAWSPDGSEIFFAGNERIQRIAAAGGTVRDVPQTTGGRSPAVSPDGQWLAFTRTKPIQGSQDFDIWVNRLD